jgi:hypothetical protein
MRKQNAERAHAELGQRNQENEEKMRDILRELQIQKEKKKAVEDIAERKTKKIEAENQ